MRCDRLVLVLLSLLVALVIGCTRASTPPSPPSAPPPPHTAAPASTILTVFAASSLTEPLEQINAKFQAAHPGVEVRANLAGTQELKIQLEQGAACDVFVSASKKNTGELVKSGLLLEPQEFARNGLCVVVDPRSTNVKTLADLAKKGVRLVVAVPGSPIGKYTRDCWEKMNQSREFGPKFVANMEGNVVSEETNAKLVLSKVLMGEADAGFVYVSDAKGKKVTVLSLSAEVQVTAHYTAGRCSASPNAALAEEYAKLLLSAEGQDILKKAGLTPGAAPAGAR